jgi:hypothetical protein
LKTHFKKVGYFLVVGLLATLTMDVAALIIVKSGAITLGRYRIVPELLGRWIGSFPGGKFVHSTIFETAAVPHEKLIGLVAHYLIGITLTSLLLFPHVRIWRRSVSLRGGALFGLATCVFPWFLMFPAMGFGIMAIHLPSPSPLMPLSVLNHVAFGMGIFFWSNVVLASRRLRTKYREESFDAATHPEATAP